MNFASIGDSSFHCQFLLVNKYNLSTLIVWFIRYLLMSYFIKAMFKTRNRERHFHLLVYLDYS